MRAKFLFPCLAILLLLAACGGGSGTTTPNTPSSSTNTKDPASIHVAFVGPTSSQNMKSCNVVPPSTRPSIEKQNSPR